MTKKALGRGLDSLISGGVARPAVAEPPPPLAAPPIPLIPLPAVIHPVEAVPLGSSVVRQLDVSLIVPNQFQPRTAFNAEHLQELADSIKQRGIVQPIVVRVSLHPEENGKRHFELVAGERRWRAARLAGLTTIPAIVREITNQEALEIALIENLQREDLNPIEEARAYDQLTKQFHLTQEQVATKVGRSRAAVANSLRLLGLPAEVQSWVVDGRVSVGHAKAILGLVIPDEQRLVAERVIKQNLTVRQTEQLVEQLKGMAKTNGGAAATSAKSPHIATIEERLQQLLGTGVVVRHQKNGKGRIQIDYYSNDELSRLLGLLGVDNL